MTDNFSSDLLRDIRCLKNRKSAYRSGHVLTWEALHDAARDTVINIVFD